MIIEKCSFIKSNIDRLDIEEINLMAAKSLKEISHIDFKSDIHDIDSKKFKFDRQNDFLVKKKRNNSEKKDQYYFEQLEISAKTKDTTKFWLTTEVNS